MKTRQFLNSKDTDDFGPWSPLIGHKLTESEVEEVRLCAFETGLTVHEWIERVVRFECARLMTQDP